MAPKKTKYLPLIQTNHLTLHINESSSSFFVIFVSLLALGYQKEKEMLRFRLKLGLVWCSILFWSQDQLEDRDRNE